VDPRAGLNAMLKPVKINLLVTLSYTQKLQFCLFRMGVKLDLLS